MKLTDDILNELIKESIGSDAVSLVSYIKNKQDVSEFKIAEELNVNINNVRNMLYRLGSFNLVSSIRKKDKKKGWYIYYWTFDMHRAAELVMKSKEKRLESLKNMLNRLSSEIFFVCKTDGTTLSLESAMEHNYKCPEDGELLVQKDNRLEIERLKREIEKLQIDVSSGIELEAKPVIKRSQHKKRREKEVKAKKKHAKNIVKIEKKGKISKLDKIKAKIAKKKAKLIKKKK